LSVQSPPNSFEPPSAERLQRHLDENPATRPAPWRSQLPLVFLGVLAVAVLLAANPYFAVLPWIALIVFMVVMSNRIRQRRQLHAEVVRAWELAMLRQHRDALGRAWRLLPRVSHNPELHTRVVVVMAHCLDDLAAWPAVLVAYDALLELLPPAHPLSAQVRVQRASASLQDDRLADADNALNKLRGAVDNQPGSVMGGYHLARLVQDVRTGHYADAIEQADQTVKAMLPLGVEAGYGYGLLAMCHGALAPREEDAEKAGAMRQEAQTLWSKATLLIPPAALVHRFPVLEVMLAAPASEGETPE